jgi:hypothetical protein
MDFVLYLIQITLDLWDLLTRYFNPELLPMGAYIVCSALALGLWWFALSLVPARLRRLLWAVAAAVLISPTVTGGGNPQLAPANVGMLYGYATDNALLWQTNLLVMVFVFFVVLLLQQLWLEIKPYHQKVAARKVSQTDNLPL